MSLRFCYEPPPRIRIVRHQNIRFFVGQPQIHFPTLHVKPVKKEKSFELDYIDEQVVQDNYVERPKVKKVKPLASTPQYEKTFASCYELLQSIRTKKKLNVLFNFKGSDLNLSDIELKLRNCCYNTIDEFFVDLTDLLDRVSESDTDLAHAAKHFLTKVEQIHGKMTSVKSEVPFSDLSHQFKKFIDVQIPAMQSIESKPMMQVSSHNLDTLASRLNSLNSEKKLKAEWLVRIHCPNLPYYATGIDLAQLPKRALEALNNYLSEQ